MLSGLRRFLSLRRRDRLDAELREERGGASIDMLVQDVRYGVRMMRTAPGFSAVAIASLALGIGASTVTFSVMNSVVFRPIAADRPEQLIRVFTGVDGSRYSSSSYAEYESLRGLSIFGGLLASARAAATVSEGDRAEVIHGVLVSENYFDVLGLRPSRGRFFRSGESYTAGAEAIAVLSHDAWRRRFGGEPAIVGHRIEMNGVPFTVIGVGPPKFAGTSIEESAEFFVPVGLHAAISRDRDMLRNRQSRGFQILGRLAAGVTLRQANAALAVAAAQLQREDQADGPPSRAAAQRVITALSETTARFAGAGPGAVMLIFSSVIATVAALLAIACVNVATVLLARATTRGKEIAVRLAIGASRRRVIRQLLTESALLALAGGVMGLAIAQVVAAVFVRVRPLEMPPIDLTLDYRIFVFSILASLLTVAFFGLAPAIQTTRPDLTAALKESTRAVRIRRFRVSLRDGLVITQVAIALALFVGAALMLRSAHAGQTADPGFRRENVLSIGIDLSTVSDQRGARARFFDQAVRAAATLPGVDRVALAALVPMSGMNRSATLAIADGGSSLSTTPDINAVGPGYFALLDIPVTQGREFTPEDGGSSPLVAVVNQTMATRFWNGDAVGKTFTEEETKERFQVVGVVRDLRHRSFGEQPMPMVYFCATQRFHPRMTLHVRTAAPPGAIGSALHRTLHDIDRAAGLTPAETMQAYFRRVTLPQRLGAAGAMATAVLEVALVIMALYGVIAFAASQREREIGLRMALGASRRSVLALIMRHGLVLTAVGIVAGVGLALAGAAALGSVLIGIGPADPLSFGGAVVLLVLVGAAASYLPARRASSVDPNAALRSE